MSNIISNTITSDTWTIQLFLLILRLLSLFQSLFYTILSSLFLPLRLHQLLFPKKKQEQARRCFNTFLLMPILTDCEVFQTLVKTNLFILQILFELQLNANFLPTLFEDLYLSNLLCSNIPKNHLNYTLSCITILHNILNPKYQFLNIYFYLTSHLSTNPIQPITYNYKYHIQIITSKSTYLYTNLFTYYSSKTISIQQSDDKSIINFTFKWSKSNTDERVIRSHITLFFNYSTNGSTQLGMATGKISGYNIAQGSIAGYLTIESGTGQSVITQKNLILNGYNLLTTQLQMSQSRNFLNYQYSSLPVNLPSDLVSVTMVANYGSYLSSNDTPSVLGQLVWSWIQYFPIFLTLYFILDKAFCFLLNEKIVRSSIVHDKQYLQLIEEQTIRRQKLRLK